MSHQTPLKRVFFHVLEGNQYAFADERTKMYLINIMEDFQRSADWKIYAFCMTDQRAYFIIEAGNTGSLNRDLESVVCQFREGCHRFLPGWWAKSILLRRGEEKQLETDAEIREYCCLLHRLPLDCGYVKRLADYWWSSYITYAGVFDWHMVDCEWLLGQFSDQQSRARQMLKDYQRMTSFAVDIHNG